MAEAKRLYLGLDVGTQGTKGLVVDADSRRIVARAGSSYELIPGLAAGAAEQHPDTWIDAIRDVASALFRQCDAAAIAAVAVSGQQHGAVVLDEDDRVVRPAKLWCDTQTVAEAVELSTAMGRNIPTGFTASKLLWIARHEPDAWARVRSVMLPHDFVTMRLTGRKGMESGDASGSGYFDPVSRTPSADDMRHIDPRLASLVAPMLESGRWWGTLDQYGAALLGLAEGTPVATGGGDNMMSAIGSGTTRAGVTTLSLGTSGTVFTHSDTPIIDPEGLIAPFCSSTGAWLPLLCVMNLTGVTEEVRRAFATDHDTLTAEASAVTIGADGLLWIPYLAGERVPDLPHASGTLLGMRAGHLDSATLFRAAIEGTSLNIAWGVDRLRALGIEPNEIRVVGGAAGNRLWRRVLADTLGCRVVAPVEQESAAFGAALQAYWTDRVEAGEHITADEAVAPFIELDDECTEPIDANVSIYDEMGARFREQVARLYDR